MLITEDFTDDSKDTGEIGAEQTVTALYEIVATETMKLQAGMHFSTVDVRYKNGNDPNSILISDAITSRDTPLEGTTDDFRFAPHRLQD
jgi:Ca-activated chloride channel family protein